MAYANPNISYPKARGSQCKIVPIARTDSSTLKCVLPKDAIITGVYVHQTVNASTAAGSFNLGWAGATTGIVNGFSMATTAVGYTTAGTATGAQVGVKLDSDKQVIATYTVGSSTAGGTGYVKIEYFIAGPGESYDD